MKRLLFLLPLLTTSSLCAQDNGIDQSLQLVTLPEGGKVILWHGKPGRSYFVQVSDENEPLAKWTWAPLIEGGNDQQISHEVGGTADRGFFRLRYTDQVPGAGESLDSADFDGDGLPNALELGIQSHPLNPDTSGDGIPDGWDYAHGLDPSVNNASALFQGSRVTVLQAYQQGVQANPASTIADYDGDGLDNDLDADPQDHNVDWGKANISGYIMIEIDVPAGAGYVRDLNDDGQVLFDNGVWSAGVWTELPKAEASGNVNDGYHIYESTDSAWKYFGPEGKILGEVELNLHSGQSDLVGVPHISLFTPVNSPSISTETIDWLDPFVNLQAIGIDQQGRIFAKKANYEYSQTGLNNEIWLFDGNLIKTGAYQLPANQRSSSDWHLTPSGWLAHWLRPSLEPESSGTYRSIVWNPQGNEIYLPGTPSPYVTSMTDLPNGKPVITAYDPGNWQSKVYLFPGTGSAFKKATGLSSQNIGLFAGDGTAMTTDGKMWINGKLTPIRDLCPAYGDLQDEGWFFYINEANKHGSYLIQAHNAEQTIVRPLLLVPVDLIDTKDKVLDDQASQGTIITAAMSDVNIDPKATVDEQKEGSIAWIEPHGADDASNAPDMPQLVLRFRGAEQMGLKIKWKLEVIYNRPRGTNPDVSQMKAQDEVFIPKKANGSQPWKEETLDGAVEIFSHADWIAELQDKGLFGGEAKLTYQLLKSGGSLLGAESIMLFSIGGKNPEDGLAKDYIDTKATAADSRLTRLSYATGRHESKDYNGEGSRYNQFWEGYARRYRIDHCRGNPLWCKSPDEESAGGFGIFQITGNLSSQFAAIPREQIWNWRKNVDAYVTIVKTGGSAAKGSAMDRFIAAVARTYPSDNEAQTSPTSYSYDGGSYDAWEMGTITLYNGAGGCPKSILKSASGKIYEPINPWKFFPASAAGTRWRYHSNSNNYLHEVIQER